ADRVAAGARPEVTQRSEDPAFDSDRAAPAGRGGGGVPAPRGVPAGRGRFLVTTRFGTPYRHDYYGSRIFAQAVAKAGLPASTTSHDLRHHYASVLMAQGES